MVVDVDFVVLTSASSVQTGGIGNVLERIGDLVWKTWHTQESSQSQRCGLYICSLGNVWEIRLMALGWDWRFRGLRAKQQRFGNSSEAAWSPEFNHANSD